MAQVEKTNYSVWTRKNLFDPETIKKSMQITPKERLKLLFHRTKTSYDWDENLSVLTRYKVMDGKIYVLSVHKKIYDKRKGNK